MLDAFKKMGNGGGKPGRQQADELQALIAASKEERAALSTMLTQIQLQTTKLATASKPLQEVEATATKAHERIDEVAERLGKIDVRTSELETLDARIRKLTEEVVQAEQEAVKL